MTQSKLLNWGSLTACLRIAAVCLLPVLLATCGEDGPGGPSGSPVIGRIEFTPGPITSNGYFGPNLPIDRVHIRIVRPPSTVLRDTTRAFDPNLNRLRIELPVLLEAAAESLDVTLELLSGPTVLFSGTSRVEARAGPPSTTPPPAIPLIYTGPGSQIAQLALAPLDSVLGQGDSLVVRVTGLDGSQLPVPAFYVGWSSSDTTIARVNGAGVVRGRVARGTVYIRARTPSTQLFPSGIVESTTVTLAPDPATLIKVGGDNQSAPVGATLPLLLAVEVRAADGLPVPGVTVDFATSDQGASVLTPSAVTDGNGVARTGAVLGTLQGTQSFTASVAGLSSVTFTATATVAPAPTWTGAVSTDWDNPGNWNLGFVPTSTDSVTVPAGPANQPLIISNNATTGTLVVDGTITFAGGFGFDLTVHGNLKGAGAIVGSNSSSLNLTGVGKTLDLATLPDVTVSGTITLARNVNIASDLAVGGSGDLTLANHTLNVNGTFSNSNSSTITMTSPLDSLKVLGDIVFAGGNTFGKLSSGVIFVRGNFGQQASNSVQSYAPTGNHIVVFNGTGVQTVTFATPGATGSNFETLVIANSAGGVTLASDVFLSGPVGFAPGVPRIAHGTGQTIFVAELLAANATLDNLLVAANNVLITQFDSINFINYSPAATPLTISHPGSATPFVFNDLSFGVVPTSGSYISVTDLVADANVLTINMVNPTPGASGGLVQTAGGAVVNWPFVPAGARTWTGAIDTDWFKPGNWNPAVVPTATDDVIIPSTGQDPVISTNTTVRDLTVQSGASVTSASALTVTGNANLAGSFLGTGLLSMVTHGTSIQGNLSALTVDLATRFETVSVSGPLAVGGILQVNRGHLDIGGHTVTTTSFFTTSEGMLRMTNPAGVLVVNGDASFGGEDPTGVLTAGTIRIRGDFVQLTSVTQGSFVASGTNRVILDGTGPQTVSFQHPGPSHFQDLEIANVSDTVYLGSDWVVAGRLIKQVGGNVFVSGSAQLITTGGVAMSSGEFLNTRVTVLAGTITQFDNITWSGFAPFSTQLTVSRASGIFGFGSHTFNSTPSSGFYLRADDTNPSDGQPLTINMVSPTPGTPGSFVQALNGAVVNWPAAAGGTAVWTGAVNSDWFNTGNWSTGVVPTAADDVDFTQFFSNAPSINADAAIRNLAVSSGRFITVNTGVTLTIHGDAVLNGTISGPGTVNMAGTSGSQIAGVFPNLTISAPYTLASTLQVNGTFLTLVSDLTIGANSLNLFANLDVQAGGRLVMTSPSALVIVTGSVTFDGPSTAGTLTAGQLMVGGNFNQNSTNSLSSFAASGTHQTVFNSPGSRTITFASPATSGFQTLVHSGAGALNLGSEVRAANYISLVANQLNGGGNQLTTEGFIAANAVFDNVPVVVNSSQSTTPLAIDNSTFQNYPATATQLSITHPGQAVPVAFDGLTFSTTPTAGGFYLSAVDQNSSDGTPLIIDVTNTTPASGSPFVQVAGGAVVNWPGGAGTVVTWTGAVSTDWAVPGNWSGGAVPAVTDSVVIPAGGNQPILTANAFAGALHLANGTLTLNGQFMAVARTFVSKGSGRLVMTNPNDGLSISGDAIFDGGNQLGFMSEGVIVIAGDFTQLAANSPDSYHPSGNHTTALVGVSPTVTFATPGLVPGSSHFQRLDWIGTGTLTAGSNLFAHAEFFVTSGSPTTIAGNGRTITAGGFGGATSVTTFDNVNLVIDQASASPLTLANLTFANQDPAVVQLSIRHPGTFPGGVTTQSVTFATTPSTGFFLRAEDTAPVDGTVLTIDMNNVTPATPGGFVQTVGGAVVNWPGSGGGSAVWTGASNNQDWNDAGNWAGNVVPSPGADVLIPASASSFPSLVTSEQVHDMVVEPGAVVDFVDGFLEVTGNLTGGGSMLTGGPEMSGSGVQLQMSDLGSLLVTGNVSLAGDLSITNGDILITGVPANFTVNGFDVTISGALTLQNSGTMVMTDPLGAVIVNGNVLFDGGPETGLLTAGYLEVHGDFTQANSSSPNSFRAGPAFQVMMNGTSPQAITFADSLLSFFRDLSLSNPTGFTVFGVPTVLGNLAVSAFNTVDANNLSFVGDGFNVLGNVTTGTGSVLHLGRLYVGGALSVGGTWTTTSVIFTGTGQTAPAGLPYQFLYSRGDVTFGAGAPTIQTLTVEAGTLTLAARTAVNGDVFLTGGTLKPNNHTIAIGGALNVQTTGTLTMQNSLDSVLVTGVAAFGGGSAVGLMTNGVLQVGGSFTQTAGTSNTSFLGTGPHKTILGAGGARVVNFATPGTGITGSHFGNLEVTPATGGLALLSDLVVDGTLIALPTGTAPTISGSTTRKVTTMSLGVTRASGTSLVLDNVQIVVDEQGSSRGQQFDRAQFTGFPTTANSAVLMDMTLVGTTVTPRPITFTAPTVQTSLGTGGLYARLLSSNTQFVTVTISGSNDPTGGPSRSNPSFGSTVNGARIVWQ